MIKVALLFKFSLMICLSSTGNPKPKDILSPRSKVLGREVFGEHQSPININWNEIIYRKYPKFHFKNYDLRFRGRLENNGRTVKLKIDNQTDGPSITGGGLSNRYSFKELHFHWDKGLEGSEHSIDGKKYPAEMHIVHFNTKYGSYDKALPHPDGLAVLGILIQLQEFDNIAFRHLEQFDKIIYPNFDKQYLSVWLADFLPDQTKSFFRYNGSLTTPKYDEDVIWTIFDTPIAISKRQLKKFRGLKDKNGKRLMKNARLIQELRNRVVTYRRNSNH